MSHRSNRDYSADVRNTQPLLKKTPKKCMHDAFFVTQETFHPFKQTFQSIVIVTRLDSLSAEGGLLYISSSITNNQ